MMFFVYGLTLSHLHWKEIKTSSSLTTKKSLVPEHLSSALGKNGNLICFVSCIIRHEI